MTREDKQLLLRDLCARLPYGVKVKCRLDDEPYTLLSINWNKGIAVIGFMMADVFVTSKQKLVNIKPYLRPMSSMTEEEYNELADLIKAKDPDLNLNEVTATIEIDWLNKNMFDYRGLIPKGLAIEVTKENNPYKIDEEIEL